MAAAQGLTPAEIQDALRRLRERYDQLRQERLVTTLLPETSTAQNIDRVQRRVTAVTLQIARLENNA